jgi:hypothetical protein
MSPTDGLNVTAATMKGTPFFVAGGLTKKIDSFIVKGAKHLEDTKGLRNGEF